MSKNDILFIDDDIIGFELLTTLLGKKYHLIHAKSLKEATRLLNEKNSIGILIINFQFEGDLGIGFLIGIKNMSPHIKRIIMSRIRDPAIANRIVNESIAHYQISKPWNNKEFVSLIDKISS